MQIYASFISGSEPSSILFQLGPIVTISAYSQKLLKQAEEGISFQKLSNSLRFQPHPVPGWPGLPCPAMSHAFLSRRDVSFAACSASYGTRTSSSVLSYVLRHVSCVRLSHVPCRPVPSRPSVFLFSCGLSFPCEVLFGVYVSWI